MNLTFPNTNVRLSREERDSLDLKDAIGAENRAPKNQRPVRHMLGRLNAVSVLRRKRTLCDRSNI